MAIVEPGAIQILTDNYWENRSNGYRPRYVIIHATAGGTSARGIANYFISTEGTSKAVSSNYIADPGGEIVCCVPEEHGAYANGVLGAGHDPWWSSAINPNWISISIEIVKSATDNSTEITPQQKASVFKLVRNICARWNIPMRDADFAGGITGHFSIDPVNRSRCPGAFPWGELWQFLRSGTMRVDLSDPIMNFYYKDTGNGTWESRNGFNLFGAIREFYCDHGGVALFGLPIGNEEIIPGGTSEARKQEFERCVIAFDPQRKSDNPPIPGQCYLMHIDDALHPNRDIEQLKANIAGARDHLTAVVDELQNMLQ